MRLNKHLVRSGNIAPVSGLPLQIDRIFISHCHHPEDGFPNLEEIDAEAHSDDHSSSSSVLRKTLPLQGAGQGGFRRFERAVGISILLTINADGEAGD